MSPLLLLLLLLTPQDAPATGPGGLRVGHVVEVRGSLAPDGRFVAEKIELAEPGADDVLVGIVPPDGDDAARFTLLGRAVETDIDTEWGDVPRGASLAGRRIKVEGNWKGTKFSAEEIALRGEGRERIGARIDALAQEGDAWVLRVMDFDVLVTPGCEIAHVWPVEAYPLAEERALGRRGPRRIERDEDDVFGAGIRLSDSLRLQGQLEGRVEDKNDYDLDHLDHEDRRDHSLSARIRLAWSPGPSTAGVAEVRYGVRYRLDDDNGVNDSENDHDAQIGETWLQWRDLADRPGFDVTVGRQDFDDEREWLYDQNLDALRVTWNEPAWRLDLSAAAILSDASERDEESRNLIAYLSNNDDDRHLAAWTVYRDFDAYHDRVDVPGETSLHVGARAIGEWVPANEVWAELAWQHADRPLFDLSGAPTGADADVSAWAFDLGTTWSPAFAAPLYLTVGYAFASGNGDDGTFRQTGLQDNNDRFGGVTSFRYYGELLDPELSNLSILTAGVGARIAERTSLDLVFHRYAQDEAAPELSPLPERAADLRTQPNGLDTDLGWEADLILGFRRFASWDVEVVGATFRPGDAFDDQDDAYFVKLQLRYRF